MPTIKILNGMNECKNERTFKGEPLPILTNYPESKEWRRFTKVNSFLEKLFGK